MSLISINVAKVQGALFSTTEENKEIRVYGKPAKVIMTGNLKAGDEKVGGEYEPLAYGQLNIRAAMAKTMGGKDYLYLSIDGGLQGSLHKVEGKEYDYFGTVEAGDGLEFPVYGRKKKSEGGVNYIAISSSEKQKKEAKPADSSAPEQKSAAAPDDSDGDFPF